MPKRVIDAQTLCRSIDTDVPAHREQVVEYLEHIASRAKTESGGREKAGLHLRELFLNEKIQDRWKPIVAKYWQIVTESDSSLQTILHEEGKVPFPDTVREKLRSADIHDDDYTPEDRYAIVEPLSESEAIQVEDREKRQLKHMADAKNRAVVYGGKGGSAGKGRGRK